MKISLLYPGITECGFNSLKGNEGTWMHHGLAILSSCLKQKGHKITLLDLRRFSGWDDFKAKINVMNYPVVAITMMSVDFNPACNAAKIIKDMKPNTTIIVGGPHASICTEELENLPFIDYIIKGEGEITLPELVEAIEKGERLPKVIDGKHLENLDDAPWADRDLFQSPEEPFVRFLKPPFVTLIAGRGCRYNCNYCQPAERLMFGDKVRRRSVNNVISELKSLRDKFHFNSWMLHDDCITEDREWVMEFTKRYREEGFNQPFVCQSRADIICRNEDMVKALSEAGVRLFIIGFESGSNRVLKFLRKGCSREMNLQAAEVCRKYGIKIWANYMMGIPTETKEEVLETYTMLTQIKPYHCSPAFYTPHPGSDLYTIGQKMGIHLIVSHDSYRRNTFEPKIKGPDYDFLKEMLYKSVALGEDQHPVKAQVLIHTSPQNIDFIKRILRKCNYIYQRIGFSGTLSKLSRNVKQNNLAESIKVFQFISGIKLDIDLVNCRKMRRVGHTIWFTTDTDDPQILLKLPTDLQLRAEEYTHLIFYLFVEQSSSLQVIWSKSSGIGVTDYITTLPGWNIYCFNLAKMNLHNHVENNQQWQGSIQSLRIDPALNPGIKMGISEIHLANREPENLPKNYISF
ncbi:MAG: radical SAM protein [Candidatus Methanoperedens sp.]|nr:radical SAM protein [Candidatus Methanoperedens sp.]